VEQTCRPYRSHACTCVCCTIRVSHAFCSYISRITLGSFRAYKQCTMHAQSFPHSRPPFSHMRTHARPHRHIRTEDTASCQPQITAWQVATCFWHWATTHTFTNTHTHTQARNRQEVAYLLSAANSRVTGNMLMALGHNTHTHTHVDTHRHIHTCTSTYTDNLMWAAHYSVARNMLLALGHGTHTSTQYTLIHTHTGEKQEDAYLLSAANYSVARNNTILALGHNCNLQLVLTPTPRWPDLMVSVLMFCGVHPLRSAACLGWLAQGKVECLTFDSSSLLRDLVYLSPLTLPGVYIPHTHFTHTHLTHTHPLILSLCTISMQVTSSTLIVAVFGQHFRSQSAHSLCRRGQVLSRHGHSRRRPKSCHCSVMSHVIAHGVV
jgi:hypothetical protein